LFTNRPVVWVSGVPRRPIVERALDRNRAVVGVGLAVIVLLAWLYLLLGAGTGMSAWAMTTWRFPPGKGFPSLPAHQWDAAYFLVMLAMWWVMMVAMMIPSAAPVILLYGRVMRHAGAPVASTIFTTGYLVAWLGFSVLATLLQWVLERAALISHIFMWSSSTGLTASLLAITGIYQLTPLKRACLRHCRSPVELIVHYQRPGRLGALVMGIRHGSYCVGCCVLLMALLFVGGLMNLLWIAGLSILVLVEKIAPARVPVAQLSGLALLAMGIWVATLH
jgi:predicted metal-binding membrane protein